MNEWISVDVAMPPPGDKGNPKRVLVYSEEYAKNGSSPFQFAKYVENKGGWIIEGGKGFTQVPWKVTHWAKITKPQE